MRLPQHPAAPRRGCHSFRQHPLRSLIVTADDFGVSREVNEAVEIAHRRGILRAASLMVGAPAAADAIARARRMPSLRVGLHLVLVDGEPVLPARQVPELIGGDGRFEADMARAGRRIFVRPAARRQLAAEIEAQFAAFTATGLDLDHVNAHKHFHVHPTIARTLIAVGGRHGLRAVRVPSEPRAVLAQIEPATPPGDPLLRLCAALLRRRVRAAGLLTTDRVFGVAWSGAMTGARVAALLPRLPDGCSELYTHVATHDRYAGSAPGYAYAAELAALTAPDTLAAVRDAAIALHAFSDLAGR